MELIQKSIKNKEKREEIQTTNIWNKVKDILSKLTEITRIIKKCDPQSHAKKSHNLDDLNKLLEIYKQPKLTQKGRENLIDLHVRKLKQ